MQKKNTKREKIQKLVLSKETLRLLSGGEWDQVVGGAPPVSKDTDCNLPDCWGNPTTE